MRVFFKNDRGHPFPGGDQGSPLRRQALDRDLSKVREQGMQLSRGKALQAIGIVDARVLIQDFARNVIESQKAKVPEMVNKGKSYKVGMKTRINQ